MSKRINTTVRRIELEWLKQNNYLNSSLLMSWQSQGQSGGSITLHVRTDSPHPQLRLCYKSRDYSGQQMTMDYSFQMEPIPCHFGGNRWFIRCGLTRNGQYCGRRVRILYFIAPYFGCRECAQITYDTCNESGRYKGLTALFSLDEKLESMRTKYYAGLPTRRYRRWLRKDLKASGQFWRHAQLLQSGRKSKVG